MLVTDSTLQEMELEFSINANLIGMAENNIAKHQSMKRGDDVTLRNTVESPKASSPEIADWSGIGRICMNKKAGIRYLNECGLNHQNSPKRCGAVVTGALTILSLLTRPAAPRSAHNPVPAASAISWRPTPPAPTDRPKKFVYGVYAFSYNAAFSDGDPEC